MSTVTESAISFRRFHAKNGAMNGHNNVEMLRRARGWSMQALADAVHPPTSASQINKLEKGHVQLTQAWLGRLGKALECAPTDLLPGQSAPNKVVSDPMSSRDEQAARLKQARKKCGFATAKAAADHHGWNYNAYSQHESGMRGIKLVAPTYANAFGVPVRWLLTGEGGIEQQGDAHMTAPNKIGESRRRAGLTLEEVAAAAGTSQQQIQRLEKGERRLTDEWMRRIAPALGCKPEELMSPAGSDPARTSRDMLGYSIRTCLQILHEFGTIDLKGASPADIARSILAAVDSARQQPVPTPSKEEKRRIV